MTRPPGRRGSGGTRPRKARGRKRARTTSSGCVLLVAGLAGNVTLLGLILVGLGADWQVWR